MTKGQKVNPLLAQYEAMLEARYQCRLDINTEIDHIALMKTVHEELGVGPGRADRVFDAFVRNRIEVARKIIDDTKSDKELLVTKRDYAVLMKRIFGSNWEKVRGMFVLLKQYW